MNQQHSTIDKHKIMQKSITKTAKRRKKTEKNKALRTNLNKSTM